MAVYPIHVTFTISTVENGYVLYERANDQTLSVCHVFSSEYALGQHLSSRMLRLADESRVDALERDALK